VQKPLNICLNIKPIAYQELEVGRSKVVTSSDVALVGSGCYGPYNSIISTTGKRHKRTSGGGVGDAGTSRAIGQGVAESHNVTL
jgi:hypothetical protein